MFKNFIFITLILMLVTICISSWYFKSIDNLSADTVDISTRRRGITMHTNYAENHDGVAGKVLNSKNQHIQKISLRKSISPVTVNPSRKNELDPSSSAYHELHKVWLHINKTDRRLALQDKKIIGQQQEIEKLKRNSRTMANNRGGGGGVITNVAPPSELSDLNNKVAKVMRYVQKQENKAVVDKYARRLYSLPTKPFAGSKFVHLDFKGAAPRVNYLIKFMTLAKRFGATGFLIEYEDMFPWTDSVKVVARKTAYNKTDIVKILKTVSDLQMELIPLVQTYGHFEFLLKHDTFKDLRRLPDDHRSINPTRKGSVPIVKAMIDQVLALHPDIKWFHIGGDEVYDLEDCDGCENLHMEASQIYKHHMIPILKYVGTKVNSKGEPIIPIIWDDMFRNWDVNDISEIAKYAVPMIWGYVNNLSHYRSFTSKMWAAYSESFKSVFFASAFKGAAEQDTDLMEVEHRARNHFEWLKVATLFEKMNMKIEGIALTGWSRFSHEQPLCELLPVSTPSLALCLQILTIGTYNDTVIHKISTEMGVGKRLIGQTGILGNPDKYNATKGHFLGSEVYTIVESVEKLKRKTLRLTNRHVRSEEGVENAHFYIKQINDLKKEVKENFPRYFYEDTINEWIKTKLDVHIRLLRQTVAKYEHKEIVKVSRKKHDHQGIKDSSNYQQGHPLGNDDSNEKVEDSLHDDDQSYEGNEDQDDNELATHSFNNRNKIPLIHRQNTAALKNKPNDYARSSKYNSGNREESIQEKPTLQRQSSLTKYTKNTQVNARLQESARTQESAKPWENDRQRGRIRHKTKANGNTYDNHKNSRSINDEA